jgi:hydrogenase maturation protein HypF
MKITVPTSLGETTRLRLAVHGAVQGVGFRPFVYRLAAELGLRGWINNTPAGAVIEAEGDGPGLEIFLHRIEKEKPPRCFFRDIETAWLEPAGFTGFEIRESATEGVKSALVLPDIATCPDCLREMSDPADRRFGHPFINCTNCGPRFSIIEALPYDRANTSMKRFPMCAACGQEYDDPQNRRFHAQPNSCPVCGPQLAWWNADGRTLAKRQAALTAAVEAIRAGKIVAVKGVGGFHLMADARNDAAVKLLRTRKRREEKPFALLFPAMECVREFCEVSELEEHLLRSPAAPIVLLKKIPGHIPPLSDSVAPGNPNLGVMLPANPLHHLLMAALRFPVVATSGNLSDEPICTEEFEAVDRLYGVADYFLVHDRPIVRPQDDSIVRVMAGREMVLRRARGYAPLPVEISTPETDAQNLLATGADLKNTIALAAGGQVFLSQHIGDLELELSTQAFQKVIADFERIYGARADRIVTDMHPDYHSTRYAEGRGVHRTAVQHHVAHVLSCMAENRLAPPVLGIAWDGTGYGTDGTIWGGEFFSVGEHSIRRMAHLRPFQLPGGDKAAREPRRSAAGLLYEMFGASAFEHKELRIMEAFNPAERMAIRRMLENGVNSPRTCSMGRLFDAVAAIINLRQFNRFEGQAAMELEYALAGVKTEEHYHFSLTTDSASMVVVNWLQVIAALLTDVQRGVSPGLMSAKFHNGLAEMAVAVARLSGQERVVLSGGCFQNRYLTERLVMRLQQENFKTYWHRQVPPNDGGIALGQIYAAQNHLQLE